MAKQDTKMQYTEYDPANYMDSPEKLRGFLDAELEAPDCDSGTFMAALGEVARAKGMSSVAQDTGLGRESLYKSLSGDVDPAFSTVLAVMRSLNLHFTVQSAYDEHLQETDSNGSNGA